MTVFILRDKKTKKIIPKEFKEYWHLTEYLNGLDSEQYEFYEVNALEMELHETHWKNITNE